MIASAIHMAKLLLLLLCFLSAAFFNHSSKIQDPNVVCSERERRALLSFKQGLTDPSGLLSSWSVLQQDCCRWTRVICNNHTGRVTELRLRYVYDNPSSNAYPLGGNISTSLLELEFLTYLDLSGNAFTGARVPSFLGTMGSLAYLNLSFASMEGMLPHQLGNLSSLRFLDLNGNGGALYVDSLRWIAGLHSLEYLDMSYVDLHRAAQHWLHELTMLPFLSQLHLSDCQLVTIAPPPPLDCYINFTSLQVLDLSSNNFISKIPNWLFNLSTTLRSLDLSGNELTGQIPDEIGQFKHLQHLIAYGNSLDGPIPVALGNLPSSLKTLSLYHNRLTGNLPEGIWQLSNLEELAIAQNSFSGTVSEVNFAKLSKLKTLSVSFNSFLFNLSSNWLPPFQLHKLEMSSCDIHQKFPGWLQTQTSLRLVEFSQSAISDTVPDWFWNLVSQTEWVGLSGNGLRGDISNVLLNSSYVDLSFNCFEGQLPRLSPNVQILILAGNSFSGKLPSLPPKVLTLNVANNSLSGPISAFLCQDMSQLSNLEVLDLSHNQFSGELSDCWTNWPSLTHLNLGSNQLSGKIPNSLCSLTALHSLQLHNNNFWGNMPFSLQECTYLGLINLGDNELTGLIPDWIGNLTNLRVLRLRSNKFIGNVTPQICQLSQILTLDLANNSLSGTVPKCVDNFSAMAVADAFSYYEYAPWLEAGYGYGTYIETLSLVTKGRELEYTDLLKLVRIIDISCNSLSGSIPTEISTLAALQFLNFSHNNLTGIITERIGGLQALESLDLSRNRFSGEIPQSLSALSFLSYLDLSYNNFSGRIPLGTQLQGFNATGFIGNAELCGAPLNISCTRKEEPEGAPHVATDEDEREPLWFYIGMGVGFAVGFWGVCGTLFFKSAWRHAYFQFLHDLKDRIYLAVLLNAKWFRNKFQRSNSRRRAPHHHP